MTVSATNDEHYDWAKALKEFDETKAGVKGLVDSGVTKLPRLFVHRPQDLQNPPQAPPASAAANEAPPLELPTIDFAGVESGGSRRRQVVEEIREAASTWGFFRMVNHGVPVSAMDAMLEAVQRFHEQPTEAKMDLYSEDSWRRVRFISHGPLREFDSACWRDVLTCGYLVDTLDQHIPQICRNEVLEYVKCMIKLRERMAELLSEALGLSSAYLSNIECMKVQSLSCIYYPICPEPDLTLGSGRHSDPTSLTLLIQDHIGGLQILHQNQWVHVPPVHGAIIANIGDLMQIISNDKFVSVEHRVRAQPVGPRVSVACFFFPSSKAAAKPFGPIKELLSENNPAMYRDLLSAEYHTHYQTKGQDVNSALPHFKL